MGRSCCFSLSPVDSRLLKKEVGGEGWRENVGTGFKQRSSMCKGPEVGGKVGGTEQRPPYGPRQGRLRWARGPRQSTYFSAASWRACPPSTGLSSVEVTTLVTNGLPAPSIFFQNTFHSHGSWPIMGLLKGCLSHSKFLNMERIQGSMEADC